MSLRLTPDALRGAYGYFITTTPYRGWRLPEPDSVRFHVTRENGIAGYYRAFHRQRDDHEIGISELAVASTWVLMRRMGHEMIHLYQRLNKLQTPNTEHNADFLQRSKHVCRLHVFDLREFV